MGADEFEKGDKVEWNYSGNKVEGTVQEKLTDDTEIKGHTVRASEDDPQYLVTSDKNDKEAAHKPSALEKK